MSIFHIRKLRYKSTSSSNENCNLSVYCKFFKLPVSWCHNNLMNSSWIPCLGDEAYYCDKAGSGHKFLFLTLNWNLMTFSHTSEISSCIFYPDPLEFLLHVPLHVMPCSTLLGPVNVINLIFTGLCCHFTPMPNWSSGKKNFLIFNFRSEHNNYFLQYTLLKPFTLLTTLQKIFAMNSLKESYQWVERLATSGICMVFCFGRHRVGFIWHFD